MVDAPKRVREKERGLIVVSYRETLKAPGLGWTIGKARGSHLCATRCG